MRLWATTGESPEYSMVSKEQQGTHLQAASGEHLEMLMRAAQAGLPQYTHTRGGDKGTKGPPQPQPHLPAQLGEQQRCLCWQEPEGQQPQEGEPS